MASIFLAELDADVIGLGEDCTNPFFAKPAPAAPAAAPPPAGRRRRMQLSVEADDDALALPKPKGIMRTAGQSTQAVVSVADCLACSGCVTSAEAVLVNAQSVDKFRDLCGPDARVFLGLAALASFGERLDCAPARAFAAVAAVLREAHGAEALSEAAAAATARAETVHEFAARLAAGAGKPEIPAPSIAVSATRYRRPDGATVECGRGLRRVHLRDTRSGWRVRARSQQSCVGMPASRVCAARSPSRVRRQTWAFAHLSCRAPPAALQTAD